MSASTDFQDVELLARALASFIKDEAGLLDQPHPISFDKVVVPNSGSPILGFLLAQKLNAPCVIFRGNDPKIHQPHSTGFPDSFIYFNGTLNQGETVILVDDSTTGGGVFSECFERLNEIGVDVNHAFVLFEPENGGARSRLAGMGVTLHSIVVLDQKTRKELE